MQYHKKVDWPPPELCQGGEGQYQLLWSAIAKYIQHGYQIMQKVCDALAWLTMQKWNEEMCKEIKVFIQIPFKTDVLWLTNMICNKYKLSSVLGLHKI